MKRTLEERAKQQREKLKHNDGVTIHTQRNSTMIIIKGPVNSVHDTRGERLRNLLILREFLIILELLLVKWRNFINLME